MDREVLCARREMGVYLLDLSSINSYEETCLYSQSITELNWLWNGRISHLNFKNINILSKNNLVIGLPAITFVKNKICAACEQGKQKKSSFKSKQLHSIDQPLHMLHMDLFGPISTASLGGKKCTLVIVDEFTKYT